MIPKPSPPRYCPERALPSRAYLPGRGRRPEEASFVVERFDPLRWRASSDYPFAFDLLNHGFPWEAHEAWERSWRCVPRESDAGILLQSLIKLAASDVKRRMSELGSATRHARSAAKLLRELVASVAPLRTMLGVDLVALAAQADRLAAALENGTSSHALTNPLIVLDFAEG